MAVSRMIDLNEDNATIRAAFATQIRIINSHRAMVPSGTRWINTVHLSHPCCGRSPQMLEGMNYPIRNQGKGVMSFVQMKLIPRYWLSFPA